MGALLMVYVLSHTDLSTYYRLAVVKADATYELGAEIIKKCGLTVFSALAGFKFIGEKIAQEAGNIKAGLHLRPRL